MKWDGGYTLHTTNKKEADAADVFYGRFEIPQRFQYLTIEMC